VSSASHADPGPTDLSRAHLRRRSIAWALLAGGCALVVGALLALLPEPQPMVETGLRAGGCGLFYGLLAFHLTRVDPDDSHLQAGLVGAVCGIHSLGLPLGLPAATGLNDLLATVLPHLALALLRAWLPVAAAALLLVLLPRRWPGLRP
jgi:hypothetical protein